MFDDSELRSMTLSHSNTWGSKPFEKTENRDHLYDGLPADAPQGEHETHEHYFARSEGNSDTYEETRARLAANPRDSATRDLAYAELALEVAAEDQERAAFRLRRAQVAVQEAQQLVRDLSEATA